MAKMSVTIVVLLLVVTCGVCSRGVLYSEPTHADGSAIEWREARSPPTTTTITRQEYNSIFEDYRNGVLDQGEASKLLKNTVVVE